MERDPLQIRVVLTEEMLAQSWLNTWKQNQILQEKFFYWFPTSVMAWLHLCRSTQYLNSQRAFNAIEIAAPKMAKAWGDIWSIWSLGCGDGSKDVPFLSAFQRDGSVREYVGLDSSLTLLEMAVRRARTCGPGMTAYGMKLDFTNESHWVHLDSQKPRIVLVLGNTLGAFGPKGFLERLGSLLREGDRIVVDGEIFSDTRTMGGYNNPDNREFAMAPLQAVGLNESQGKLTFEAVNLGDGLNEVRKSFVIESNCQIHLAGAPLQLKKGHTVQMSGSLKYEEGVLPRLLKEAGFEPEFTERSQDGQFILIGARKSARG